MSYITEYYGKLPYYRKKSSGNIFKPPERIRLKDGSTRTDPDKYLLDPLVLEDLDIELTELTQQEIEIAKNYRFQKIKQSKIQNAESYFQSKISLGFVVPNNIYPSGAVFGLSDQDLTLLMGAYILLKESLENNFANSTYITDKNGNTYCLGLEQMTLFMLSYGNYRSKLSVEYNQKIKHINEATSLEDLNNL